jgi:hypothetical protein
MRRCPAYSEHEEDNLLRRSPRQDISRAMEFVTPEVHDLPTIRPSLSMIRRSARCERIIMSTRISVASVR